MNTNLLIEYIFNVLATAASGYAEIAARVTTLASVPVNVSQVTCAIAHLRRHSADYGWTIPHCRRGPDSEGRLIRVLIDNDGDVFITDDARHPALHDGMRGTLSHLANMSRHHSESLRMAVSYYQGDPAMQQMLRSMIFDVENISGKAAFLRDSLAA